MAATLTFYFLCAFQVDDALNKAPQTFEIYSFQRPEKEDGEMIVLWRS